MLFASNECMNNELFVFVHLYLAGRLRIAIKPTFLGFSPTLFWYNANAFDYIISAFAWFKFIDYPKYTSLYLSDSSISKDVLITLLLFIAYSFCWISNMFSTETKRKKKRKENISCKLDGCDGLKECGHHYNSYYMAVKWWNKQAKTCYITSITIDLTGLLCNFYLAQTVTADCH